MGGCRCGPKREGLYKAIREAKVFALGQGLSNNFTSVAARIPESTASNLLYNALVKVHVSHQP